MTALAFTEHDVELESIRVREANRPSEKITELATSIEHNGLLNRVLLRSVGPGRFELIAGHRRMRAYEELALTSIPAKVYQCTAEEAEDLAEIDNLQRVDLTPIQEGEAYQRMLERAGDVAELARRVGRTETHVRQRMRLADLLEPIRELVNAEKLDLGAAELIAQTPRGVQTQLAPHLKRYVANDGRVSRRDVQGLLEEYARPLSEAAFDVTDATLSEKAGPCGTCTKRTGVQGVLVEVLDATDTCLDSACWNTKVEAHRSRAVADAKKRGLKVLSDKEAEKVLSPNGIRTLHQAPFRAVTEDVWDGSTNVPISKLLDESVPRTLAFSDDGRAVELVPKKVVDEALAARSKTRAKAGAGASQAALDRRHANEDKKRRQRAVVLKRSRLIAMRQVAEAIEGGRISIETVLRVIVAQAGITEAEEVCRVRSLEAKSGKAIERLEQVAASIVDDQKTVEKRLRGLASLAAQLAVISTVHVGSYAPENQTTPAALKAFDVDLAACRRAAAAELAAEDKGPKPKATTTTTTKPTKKTRAAKAKAGPKKR